MAEDFLKLLAGKKYITQDEAVDCWCSLVGNEKNRSARKGAIKAALDNKNLNHSIDRAHFFGSINRLRDRRNGINTQRPPLPADKRVIEFESFKNWIEQQITEPANNKPLIDPREKRTLLHLVYALKETLVRMEGDKPEPRGRDRRLKSQKKIIDYLLKHQDLYPLKDKKTLDTLICDGIIRYCVEKNDL